MKKSAKVEKWPLEMKEGNSVVSIYKRKNRTGSHLYCVAYKDSGQRKRVNFSTLDRAKAASTPPPIRPRRS
jgi:hypothetical protein